MKLLVVDDEKDILSTMQELLEMDGYEVLIAYNGKSALKIFAENKFDLIITDAMMPIMNGLEFIQAIRGEPYNSNIPIILMSAMGSLERAPLDGWDLFIKKPSDIDAILNGITSLLIKK